jgi:hypothetical protein
MPRLRSQKFTSFRPAIEVLERRWVPTTITPMTFLDVLGTGSLRDAVLQFNADTGTDDDIIQLQAGTYHLTIPNAGGHHETAGLTGDLNLTQTSHRWIIQGAGSSGNNATIIDASQLQDRVFQIVNPGTQVVIQDLVIQGGLAQDDGLDGADTWTTDALGGGILNNGGDITLIHVVIRNNVARGADSSRPSRSAQGAGLYSNSGSLAILATTITGNQATGVNDSYFAYGRPGGAAHGGGLYASGGSLDISGSAITANQVSGGRGGSEGAGGAAQGGGLYTSGGAVSVSATTIAANQVNGGRGGEGSSLAGGIGGASQGGGLYATAASLTIADTTIAANGATGGDGGHGGSYTSGVWPPIPTDGGGGGGSQGGGLYLNAGMLTLTRTTISSNSVLGGHGGAGEGGYYSGAAGGMGGASQGGGVYGSGLLAVTNSTISANTVRGGDGGPAGGCRYIWGNNGGAGGACQGGGLYGIGTLTVTNSTICTNDVCGGDGGDGGNSLYGSGGNGGNGEVGRGGGFCLGSGTLELESVTVAENIASDSMGGAAGTGGHLGASRAKVNLVKEAGPVTAAGPWTRSIPSSATILPPPPLTSTVPSPRWVTT